MEGDNEDDPVNQVLGNGGMNFVHLNVASILGAHKMEMLRKQVEISGVHVFGASESWLHDGIPDGLVEIRGYKCLRHDRQWSESVASSIPKKGGGLICYIQENLDFNKYRYSGLNQSTRDLEMQWVSLESKNMRRIVIINIYRPPQGDYKAGCKLIHEAIKLADLKDNAEIILMGDFNIDLKSKSAKAVKELRTTTELWGLKPLISSITKPNMANNGNLVGGTCIDNIFTNSGYITTARVLNWNYSDHFAVFAKRKRESVQHNKVDFYGRSYRNYIKEDLQTELINLDWAPFYNAQDPEWCWEFLEGVITKHLDKTCPLKKFRVNEVREPWVTNEILEEIKDKDGSIRRARKSEKKENWIKAKSDRNRVGRLVERAKADFLREQQELLENDPKKFWRIVKSIIPGKKAKTSKISLIDRLEGGNEDVSVEPADTADYINNFFSNIGLKLALQHTEPWVFHGTELLDECPGLKTNFAQVLQLCKEINTSKSSGIPNCATKVLRDAFMVLIPQLVFLFNLSFDKGAFPDKWKVATIIPLYKGGDKTDVGNYRPVSLLPLPGKLIEKIAHSYFSGFLEFNGVLTENQGGFRKGFSTAGSIVDLTNLLLNNVNSGNLSLAAFIDLRKAFDTVNHEILLEKLCLYGIKHNNLKWCANYLTNRFQKTMANGVLSRERAIACGVPQGSVLGPLFFIVYVNDVMSAVKNVHVQLYADDTVLVANGKTVNEASECYSRLWIVLLPGVTRTNCL